MRTTGKGRMRRRICGTAAALMLLSMLGLIYISCARSDTSLYSNPIDRELSGTVVNCMLQDSNGFLWFGTQTGLYRYNGYSLKPYVFKTYLSNKFISNFITSIYEDGYKNLWAGTLGGGLFKLDPQTGEYVNFSNDARSSDTLSDNTIRAICGDASGRLWIGTQNRGLDCLDPASGRFNRYGNMGDGVNSPGSNTVVSICRDKTGALWIGTAGGGLNKFDPQSGGFLRCKNPAGASGGPDNGSISELCIDRAGILWIVTGDGRLNSFDTASGEFMENNFEELEDLKVTAVCEDNSGTLWVGTYGKGVRMLYRDSGKFVTRGGGFSQDTASDNYRVVSLYADTSGNLWIGTEGSGVNRVNINLSFLSYKNSTDSGVSFSDDVVLSIYKDSSGVIWTGTANGGINRFDRENNRVTCYKNDPKDSGSISGNAVSSIYEDSRGTLWFGTIDGVLNKFEAASGRFEHYRINHVEDSNAGDNGIMRMLESGGRLWLCLANGGLVRFDKSTGLSRQFTENPHDPYSISSNHVLSIVEDGAGILWIGTGEGGLNRLDPSSEKFARYGVSGPDSAVLTFNYNVNAIADDGGLLWLATDKGLFRFEKSGGRSVFIKDEQQAGDASIFGLLKDGRDNLWLSTPGGLVKYNVQSGVFKKYGFDEGLQGNQYTPGAYYKSADNEMFFGGADGFNCFYADKIKDNTHKPPVVITDFKIFDTSIKLNDADKILLTYRDNFISFEFAALDYANPVKNQYAYKLEGFDTDWHYSGTRNYASYTNLDGGEYVLRVKASNNDGLWNEQDTRISIVVTPPFWKTVWFYIAAFVLASASIILLIKFRTESIKSKSLELERQVAERTRDLDRANEQLRRADRMKSDFLSMVSHEIRTPLSAILGFTELIAGKIEKTILPGLDLQDGRVQREAERIGRDLSIIISEGDRLSALVNDLLNVSKIESGTMDWKKEILAVPVLVERALSATRPIVEKAGLAVHVEIEAGLPEISGDRDMLTQVFVNLISNAVKFTREGYIRVRAGNTDSGILVSIEDTGAGIRGDQLDRVFERFYKSENRIEKEKNDGMGLGLYICRQIVEKHGGRIWAESQSDRGSIFYFTLPPA